MMPLEQQVAPLAESQRLKELGFPQDTLFVWMKSPGNEWALVLKEKWHACADCCAAPTVGELGEWLPSHCLRRGDVYPVRMAGQTTVWMARTVSNGEPSEAAGRARLLIALCERGLVTFRSLGGRGPAHEWRS